MSQDAMFAPKNQTEFAIEKKEPKMTLATLP